MTSRGGLTLIRSKSRGFINMSEVLDTIIQGDAVEVMRQIPDSSIDMVFADPPFNLKKSYDFYEDDKDVGQYLAWCKDWIHEMVRVTKPTGSIFVHNIPKWLTFYACYLNEEAHFKHWIAWDAMGAPLGKTLLPNHYGILWYVKSKDLKFYDIRTPHLRCRECNTFIKDYGGKKDQMHPFGTLVSDVWTDIYRVRHNVRRDRHPCQLPEPLLERLILMVTDEGDIVLDPFVGTGTTAVAAKRLGRKYIGVDIDPTYVEVSRGKVETVRPTMINECYVSVFLGRILTVRDRDYDKIGHLLKSDKLCISRRRSKQLTLPYLREA